MTYRVCTNENPYTKERDSNEPGRRWVHVDAEWVNQEDGWPSGDIVTWKCKNCDISWKEELPQ